MLELYENIKKHRKMNKWSQEELARRAGYTDRSSIAKIERGQFDLPQSKILLFAEIFGITPGELMGNDGVRQNVGFTNGDVVVFNDRASANAERKHIESYRKLIPEYQARIDNLTAALLAAQEEEALSYSALQAAHERTDIPEGADAQAAKAHDLDAMKDF